MAAGTADAHRVQGLAHVHLNLHGWLGLAVVGTRGAPRRDVAALEDLLLRVSALVEAHPEIVELDCNPVMVLPDGVVVDARVRVEVASPPPLTGKEPMEPGHRRRPGIGQAWTGSPVRWCSR